MCPPALWHRVRVVRVRAWPHAFGNPSGRKATANVNAVAVDHVLSFVLLGSYPSSESSAPNASVGIARLQLLRRGELGRGGAVLVAKAAIDACVEELLDHGGAAILVSPEEGTTAVFGAGEDDAGVDPDHIVQAFHVVAVDDLPKAGLPGETHE